MPRILANNTFYKGNKVFKIHPQAKAAIDFFHSIPPLFNGLDIGIKKMLSKDVIVRGILLENEFLAIDPVWTFKNWYFETPDKNALIISYKQDELEESDVTRIIWSSTLNIIFNSLNKTKSLAKLQDALNDHVPPRLLADLSGENKKVTTRHIAQWLDGSPATVTEQRKKDQAAFDGVHGDLFGYVIKSLNK